MQFFTTTDFDFFSSLRKTTYNKNDPTHITNGNKLLQGVFAKTEYWAKLLEQKGFRYEFSNRWQYSGYYRSYTWAKIYLPNMLHNKVFFTIGVGSRFTEGERYVNTLEYKIDCQRGNNDSLDPSLIYEFDKYMGENCPDAARMIIEKHEIVDLGWDELIDQTLEFINFYRKDYLKLIQITHLSDANLAKKIVRLCWNENKWIKPSGEFGKSKSTGHPFEKEKGYGYEEWLFNPDMEIDGYRYGFIQAFHKGDHKGKKYEVAAYAIRNSNNQNIYYWIAKIKELEILTIQQQEDILSKYENRGLSAKMLNHLEDIEIQGFDYLPIHANNIVNVRYKVDSDNWIRYEDPIQIENPTKEIGKNKHYVALPKQGFVSIDELPVGAFTFKEGHIPTSTGTVLGKREKLDFLMSLKHKDIQEKMYSLLLKHYKNSPIKVGTENRTGFGTSIDLVVNCPIEGNTFYEIKTCGSPLQCIREALGQLFEYNYYTTNNHARKLIVVGLMKATQPIRTYLNHLRVNLGINIFYQHFDYENEYLREIC